MVKYSLSLTDGLRENVSIVIIWYILFLHR